MKILILRTFAHNRVWENERSSCDFESGQWLGMIDKWEPNYETFATNEFKFALGIYTNQYFTHVSRYSSIASYSGTPEEDNISILKLTAISDSDQFSTVRTSQLFVHYNFHSKLFPEPNRELMKTLDREFIAEKQRELLGTFGKVPMTPYLPLSFSLSLNAVTKILQNNEINHDYLGGL